MSDTLNKVCSLVVEQMGVEADRVTPTARFVEDLEADSLDMVELAMALEEAFGVEIEDDVLPSLQTPNDVVALLAKHKK